MCKDLCVYKHVYTSTVSRCAHVPVCVYECGHDIVCACVYVGVCFICTIEFTYMCVKACVLSARVQVCVCVCERGLCVHVPVCVSACLCVSPAPTEEGVVQRGADTLTG